MATVAGGRLTVGKTYLFKNKADGVRALNVWCSSSYPATNLSNVCLWTADSTDDAQLWKIVDYNGHYVLQSVENPAKYLDLFTGTGDGANRNAQLYSVSSTCYLNFEAGAYSNTVRIRLAGSTNNGHYLTANQGSNGTRTGKTTGAAGNVYFWGSLLTDNSQEWIFQEVGGTSSGDDNEDTGSDIKIPSNKYNYICQQTYPWVNNAYNITQERFQNTGCAAVAATMFMQIMDNDPSIVPEDLFEWGVIGNSDGYPYALWDTSGAPVDYTFYKVASAWNTTAKTNIYNEITSGRPVIIHLKDTGDGTHFVVGYGLKAGTTTSNMTYDKIYVLDPWTPNNETLQDTMNYTTQWSIFGNVRIAQ